MSTAGRQGREAAIFELLRAAPTTTVSELATRTGLSRPTITSLLASLEQAGLAEPQTQDSKTAGRPAGTWAIARAAGFVIGVDLLYDTAIVATAHLDGRLLSADLVSGISADRAARLTAVRELIARRTASDSDGPLRAITVSTTGTVDAEGAITETTAVPQWQRFPLGATLSTAFGLPVRVENDVNASAFGEFAVRCAGSDLSTADDLLYVSLSRGIVTGLVLGGRLHRGKRFNAGEVGLALTEPSGPSSGRLAKAAESIGAVAAALDPSTIVLALPYAHLPGALLEIQQHLSRSRTTVGADLHFEPTRLGQGSAIVGALALALHDGQDAVLAESAPSVICPTGLDPIAHAIAGGSHTPMPRQSESTSTAALRVGVVGVGARASIARHFERPGLDAVVTSACEPHPEGAARVVDRLGRADIALTRTVGELIATGLDLAVVTSPDDTHADAACELLAAGVPVYLEKPLATTLADSTRILTTAFETGTKLYVGHNMRHMNVVRVMRDLIRRGDIGEVKAIWCRHFVGHGGDYYFKDWHATREHGTGLLLQKAAHDIDVMHWLADSHTTRVSAMGGLTVYDQVTDRADRSGQLMGEWFNRGNWPPLSQKGLNPVIDVEDVSMMLMRMESGVFASYQQCHYTPDYWRNYTVIGTEGRIENFGDGEGGHVTLWNRRSDYSPDGDAQFPILGDADGHGDADVLTVTEFVDFVRNGTPTDTSPLGAWYAVAAGIQATESLRDENTPRDVPALPQPLIDYFVNNQVK